MKKNKLIHSSTNLKDKLLWLTFIIFSAIVLVGLLRHSPWRDEAQAWLIVRDLNLVGVISQMPYEGTPPLWHLLIMPLVKLGLPYEAMLFFHVLLALTLVFILLFYSPFPKLIKILIPFNYYFLFEYALVARNYSLSALLLFIIAALYPRRLKHPFWYAGLIFLLSWTNIHSFVAATMLLLFFCYDIYQKGILQVKKNLLAASLAGSGILAVLIMLIPQPDQLSSFNYGGLNLIGRALSVSLVPWLGAANIWAQPSFYFLISLIWLPLIFLLLKSWQTRLFFLSSSAWLFFIFVFKHGGDYRHYGLLLVFFIFAWWLDAARHRNPGANQSNNENPDSTHALLENENLDSNRIFGLIIITGIFLGGLAYGIFFYYDNWSKKFSGAKEMAIYLKANNLLTEEIAAYPSYSGSALLPYLPDQSFYQFESIKKGTFLTWDKVFFIGQKAPYQVLKNEMLRYYSEPENRPAGNSILLLSPFAPGFDPELELVAYNTRASIKQDEFFFLYRLNLAPLPLNSAPSDSSTD